MPQTRGSVLPERSNRALVTRRGRGRRPVDGQLAGSDIEAQTRQCLRNVEEVLAACGASLDDVLRVGVFLVHRSDFDGMKASYAPFRRPPPARTTVYVGLPGELRVEIDALAVVPRVTAAPEP